MDTLKTIIAAFLQKRKLDKPLKVYRVFDIWEQAVGTRVARHSQPKRFKDGILWIAVNNSTWMQQLTFLSEDICRKVNLALGSPMVEKVRFQLGEVTKHGRAALKEMDTPPEWTLTELDSQTSQAIDHVVGSLSDEELKERLKSLFKKNSQLIHHHDKR